MTNAGMHGVGPDGAGGRSPSPRNTRRSRTRIIALMNQKGGVGKTTTTVNLGAGLAELGHPTLIVDLDPQAHATLHLGVDPEGLESSVYDALLDPEASALDAVLELRPKLALLPAEVNLAAAETELASAPDRQRRLGAALDPLLDLFDFVLIDCPPSLGLLTLNALAAAQEVVVPMQSHFLALQGVGKLLETVRLVSAGVNDSLVVSGVVLCMHDENTNHAREVVADLEAFFEESKGQAVPWRDAQVYRPAVRRNIKLAECPSFGQTIFEYAAWCPGALDYRALAATIAKEQAAAMKSDAAPEPEAADAPEVTVRGASAASTGSR